MQQVLFLCTKCKEALSETYSFSPKTGIIEMNRKLSEVDEMFRTVMHERDKALKQRDQAERNYMELLKENHALCESRKADMEENAALRSKRDTLQMANKWLAEENLKLREEKKSLNIQVARLQDRLDRTIEERIRRWFE